MFGLPLQTHRYFICPISESEHLKSMLIKRFLNFTVKLENSPKNSVRHLFKHVQNDVQSICGSNLRNIRLLLGKDDQYKLVPSDARDINYFPVDDENRWRIDFLKELVDLKHGDLNIGLNHDEIYEIIEDICTS